MAGEPKRQGASREASTGPVTFLLTDVEGSTRRWQADPAAMQEAIAGHDALVGRVVAECGGVTIKSRGEGDSTFSVFDRPIGALEAAVTLQRSLEKQLRVRMAIHTGEAQFRDDDYFGPTINRCARLRSIAFGGQVLVSAATTELIRDHLPAGVILRDLGTHALKDLERSEHVFQIAASGLDAEFPALKSLHQSHNLPVQLTSFIGRRRELEELKLALTVHRLVTLTGTGGCGKTRLALQTAAETMHEYPDGVYFVDLSAIIDESLIAASVATALGVREQPGRSLEDTVIEHVARRKLLLVLDNCEQLLEGCTALTGRMLAEAAELRVVATSQQPLNVAGGVRWRVPPLELPRSQVAGGDHHSMIESEAVQLFVERARLARPDFALDDKSRPTVAQICRRLDGIPLAIELAAAQISMLTPNDIVARLDDRFRLLGMRKRLGAPRQQTLLAAVTWSHDLLVGGQQVLFRRLSVFAGGFDIEAAEAVGAGGSVAVVDVLSLLSDLVDKSLVMAGEGSARRARYRLLETLREFARARLIEAGEDQEVKRRHALHYLELVDDSEHRSRDLDADTWLDRVDEDHDNARSALDWALGRDSELAVRLAIGWSWYRLATGYLTEGRESLTRVLDSNQVSTDERIDALRTAGMLAFFQGDLDDAGRRYEEAWFLQGEEATERSATILVGRGNVALERADRAAARAFYARALEIGRQCGVVDRQATALGNLGEVALWENDLPAARSLIEQALALHEKSGDRKRGAELMASLAQVALEQGRIDETLELLRAALAVFTQFKDPLFTATAIEAFGEVAATQEHPERALRLGGAGTALKERIGSREVFAPEKARKESRWTRMRELLPAATAAAAWESGMRMNVDEAVSYALSDS
jgi:predicted ATPase/class 3 adenylate cyclase